MQTETANQTNHINMAHILFYSNRCSKLPTPQNNRKKRRVTTSIVVEYSMSSSMASTVSRIVFLSSSTFFSSSGEPRYTRDFTQVAQIVGPSLANCGNRWQMVGWHANNEPKQAQQL